MKSQNICLISLKYTLSRLYFMVVERYIEVDAVKSVVTMKMN